MREREILSLLRVAKSVDNSVLYLNFDAVWISFFNFEENTSKLCLVSIQFDEDRNLGPGAGARSQGLTIDIKFRYYAQKNYYRGIFKINTANSASRRN